VRNCRWRRRSYPRPEIESTLWIQTARSPERKNGRSAAWEQLRSRFQNPSAKPTKYANRGSRIGAGRAKRPRVWRAWQGRRWRLGFQTEVERVVDWRAAFGKTSALILTLLLTGWSLGKWFERRRFLRRLERSRISAQDLKDRLGQGENLVVVDLRSDLAYQQEGFRIPGAIHISPGEFDLRKFEIPKDRPVVMYCT